MRAQKKQLDPVSSQKPCFKCPGCNGKRVFENYMLSFTENFRDEEGNLVATNWHDIKAEIITYLKQKLIESGKNVDNPNLYNGIVMKDKVLYCDGDIDEFFRKSKGNLMRFVKQHVVLKCDLTSDEFFLKFPMFKPER